MQLQCNLPRFRARTQICQDPGLTHVLHGSFQFQTYHWIHITHCPHTNVVQRNLATLPPMDPRVRHKTDPTNIFQPLVLQHQLCRCNDFLSFNCRLSDPSECNYKTQTNKITLFSSRGRDPNFSSHHRCKTLFMKNLKLKLGPLELRIPPTPKFRTSEGRSLAETQVTFQP